jgi:hypothetical protein
MSDGLWRSARGLPILLIRSRCVQDGEYVRLTFAIDDIEPVTGGGTGFMPGTHRAAELAGPAVPLEPWANMNAESGIDVGTNLDGAAQMFGKAGCCAVNYTTIWHRRVPNLGECRGIPPRFPLVFP